MERQRLVLRFAVASYATLCVATLAISILYSKPWVLLLPILLLLAIVVILLFQAVIICVFGISIVGFVRLFDSLYRRAKRARRGCG